MADGYKGHREGSPKEKVHKKFDEKGKDAAIALALKLDIQETTARTWCSSFKNESPKKAKKAKAAAKKVVKKAAPKAKAKAPAKKAAKPKKRESLEDRAAA